MATAKSTQKSLSEVENFISKKLPALIRADLRSHQLVKEADVECACYFHIRIFLGKSSSWTILARRHIPHIGRYIDLLLFQNQVPRIAMEIKWAEKSIGKKDRSSLNGALTELGVNKAYWLSASGLGHDRQPLEKTDTEKYSLKQIVVRGDFNAEEELLWKQTIPKFRKKMGVGKGKKLGANNSDEWDHRR